ncbi:putative uncharacterized protein [Clostridium sp. CAG:411]|jgi:uncharacterized membrane protein|nr:putative uncharacterized protein [Clostridium sp. CAG:411]
MISKYLKRFILCGFAGWCLECFWTGLGSIITASDKTLPCRTSVWMFPIYGTAMLIVPISKRLKGKSILIRGGIYTILIFLVEFITGSILSFFHLCPWDYSQAKFQIHGLIRLDYAPVWFLTGLFFEKLLNESHRISLFKIVYGNKKN